jgi:dienelactone hydrolase
MQRNIYLTLPILVLWILGSIGPAGCTSVNVPPPDVVDTWKPPEGIDLTSPVSCEENRILFSYDRNAPLDVQELSRSREVGVTVIDLTYASPMGRRVPATLVVPDGKGPFAGILYQHGMPSTRQPLIPGAVTYARMGAVVILIDAPFNRPEHDSAEPVTFTEQDRREQIQLIIDLRRAVDLLLSRPDVDPHRIAYIGISYGGAMGGLLAGVEDRLKGYVLQVGDGGLVTHFTGTEDTDWWLAKSENVRRQWLDWMWPIEPIHYVACASPAELLFQNGTLDKLVPPTDALRFQDAGSEPKTVLWYEDGHGLGIEAGRDQAEWLSEIIGIDSYRFTPRSVEITLTIWFFMTAACLIFLVWVLWRARPAPRGARLMWLLTASFLGPLGLGVYWMASRQRYGAEGTIEQRSQVWQALSSAAWAATGNMLGGIGVLALILYLPQLFGTNLILQIPVTFLVPFCAGWLVFAASRWISLSEPNYTLSYQRSMFAEAVSTCWVLVGVYPTVNILGNKFIGPWTAPFGFDLSYSPVWGVLCLAAFIGTLMASPLHIWLIRRDEIRWDVINLSDEDIPKRMPWYLRTLLLVISFILMLGAVYLSVKIS